MANIIQTELQMKDNASPVLKGFVSQVDKFKVGAESAGKGATTLGGAMNSIMKMSLGAAGGMAAIGTAVAKVSFAVVEAGKEAYDYGLKLGKLSTITGVAAADLDKLNQAAELSGMSFEELSSTLSTMMRQIGNATTGQGGAYLWIKDLGINIDELKSKNPSEQFLILSKAISQIENPMLRAKAAFEMFGRSNDAVLPLIERTKTGMIGFESVWNDAKVADIQNFEKNLITVKQAFGDLAAELVNNVIPALMTTFEFFGIGSIGSFVKLQAAIKDTMGDIITLKARIAEMDAKGGERTFQEDYRSAKRQLAELENKLKLLQEKIPASKAAADTAAGKTETDRTNKIDSETTQARINAEQKMSIEIIAINEGMFAAKKKLLELEKLNYITLGVDKVKLAEWETAKIKELDDDQLKANMALYAEIMKIRSNDFNAEMKNLQIKEMELRKAGIEEIKITEYVALQKGKIRADALIKEKALMNEYEEFYKGGAPSEARFRSNKTYERNEGYGDVDQEIKDEKRHTSYMDEFARDWATFTGKKADLRMADTRAAEKWAYEMESIYGETFQMLDVMGEEGIKNHYRMLGLTEEMIQALEAEGNAFSDLDVLFQTKMAANRTRYESELEKWTKTAQSFSDQLDAIVINMAEGFTNNFSDAFISFIDGTKSAEQAFREFASTFLKEMAAMILKQTILNSLKEAMNSGTSSGSGLQGALGWLGAAIGGSGGTTGNSYSTGMTTNTYAGGFSGRAKGDAFDYHGMMNYAKGDVVYKPTLFNFAKGTGQMGEAGPEGILPLARNAKGELGVKSGGGRGISISNNITISNSGNMSETEQRQQGRMVSDMLDAKIMDSLMKYERSRSAGGIR